MSHQLSFFDLEDRHAVLSSSGNPPEKALKRSDCSRGSRGSRSAFDSVSMFKVLVLQAIYKLSDGGAEFHIRNRLTVRRFFGLDIRAIWLFREYLSQTAVIRKLVALLDEALRASEYLANEVIDQGNTGSKVWADTAYRSLQQDREFPGMARAGFSYLFPQVAGQDIVAEVQENQCRPFERMRPCRSCLRLPERSEGAVHQYHRHRPRHAQDWHGQSRLQHDPPCLLPQENCAGILRRSP